MKNKPEVKKESEKSKIWLGDEGVLRIKIGKTWGEEIMEKIVYDVEKIINNQPTKTKILVDLNLVPTHFTSSKYRRNVVKIARDAIKKIKFEKVAIFGTTNTITKVVISFVVSAARLKNIKIFDTEKQALKWLKEE